MLKAQEETADLEGKSQALESLAQDGAEDAAAAAASVTEASPTSRSHSDPADAPWR